jgi:hypothetical protein
MAGEIEEEAPKEKRPVRRLRGAGGVVVQGR